MSTTESSSSSSLIRAAIVTGASRGIGHSIALRLAADGFKIAVNYSGNTSAAQEVVSDIQALGGEAIAIQADVSQRDDVRRLFDTATQAFGSITVVVHSAGVMQL